MKLIVIVLMILLVVSGCEYVLEEAAVEPEVEEEAVEEAAVEPEVEVVDDDDFSHVDRQHWTHMPITYYVINEDECGEYETRKIKKGFDAITEATDGIVTFKKIVGLADIEVTCGFIEDCYEKHVDIRRDEGVIYKYETMCSHIKGMAQITAKRGDQILKARIKLIGLAGFAETTGSGMSGFYIGSCGHATTEIHEILHVFGYGHVDDEASIMYRSEDAVGYTIQARDACVGSKKEIDDWIAADLKEVYGNATT